MTSVLHTSSTMEINTTPDMLTTSTLPSENQEMSDCSTEAQNTATAPPPSTKDAMESQIPLPSSEQHQEGPSEPSLLCLGAAALATGLI